MDDIVEQVFIKLLPWLEGRTRFEAGHLRRSGAIRQAGGDGGHDDLSDELLSRATVCFYIAEEGGWFKQVSRVSLVAHVRSRLNLCLQATVTTLRRERKKARQSDSTVESPDDGEAIDIHETLIAEGTKQADELLAELERDADTRSRVRRAVEALANPSYRLVLKVIYFPLDATEEDIAKSAAFKAGGSVFVLRPVPEAWSLLSAERTAEEATEDAPEWKRTVAWIIRLRCPRADANASELRTAVATVDQKLTSAKRALAATLEEET